MKVTVNDQVRDIEQGATVEQAVADLLQARGPRGVAVALNGEVVPRGRWGTARLEEGDRVEVVGATQGG